MAVFNTSKNNVFLKKISLKAWKLRDEVETVIKNRLTTGNDKIDDLSKEYSSPSDTTKVENPISIPLDMISLGKAIISEIDMEGIRFFSDKNYLIGNSLIVELQIPRPFRLNGVVLKASLYDLKSRIISKKKLPYRLQLKWTFLKQGERTLLREFLESLNPINPKISPSELEKKSA